MALAAASFIGFAGLAASAAVLCVLAALWWALGARKAPTQAAPINVDLGNIQASMECHCDLALDGLCDAALDDEVLQSLERDFGGQTAFDDQLDLDLGADFEAFGARLEDRRDGDLAPLDALCEKVFDLGDDLPPLAPPADCCDRVLEGMCDLALDDQQAAVLKDLEIELEGPGTWDDEPQAKAFCVREMEEALSRRTEERLAEEASALCMDGALENAFEEFLEQLLAQPAVPVQQPRCVSLLEVIIKKVRRAWALYLWWVI